MYYEVAQYPIQQIWPQELRQPIRKCLFQPTGIHFSLTVQISPAKLNLLWCAVLSSRNCPKFRNDLNSLNLQIAFIVDFLPV